MAASPKLPSEKWMSISATSMQEPLIVVEPVAIVMPVTLTYYSYAPRPIL